jgi:hypothetical protein
MTIDLFERPIGDDILQRLRSAVKKPFSRQGDPERVINQERAIVCSWSSQYTTAREYGYSVNMHWSVLRQCRFYTAERSYWSGQRRLERVILYEGDCLESAIVAIEKGVQT